MKCCIKIVFIFNTKRILFGQNIWPLMIVVTFCMVHRQLSSYPFEWLVIINCCNFFFFFLRKKSIHLKINRNFCHTIQDRWHHYGCHLTKFEGQARNPLASLANLSATLFPFLFTCEKAKALRLAASCPESSMR